MCRRVDIVIASSLELMVQAFDLVVKEPFDSIRIVLSSWISPPFNNAPFVVFVKIRDFSSVILYSLR